MVYKTMRCTKTSTAEVGQNTQDVHTNMLEAAVETETHIVQHDAHKHVEGNPEEVDDGGSAFFRHVLAAHLHHAGPEQTHASLKDTEGQQLYFALKCDACNQQGVHADRTSKTAPQG